MQMENGSFLAAWTYRGPDTQAATHSEMQALVARLNECLKLGTGWMLHVDCIRSSAPGYSDRVKFPSITGQVIDDERRQQFSHEGSHFESDYFIALTYMAKGEAEQKATEWLYEGNRQNHNQDTATRELEYFSMSCRRFDDLFASIVHARRLKTIYKTGPAGEEYQFCELTRYIRRCVTGEDFPYAKPDIPVFMHKFVGGRDFVGGLEPMLGKKHIRVVAINGFPKASFPGMIAAIDSLSIEFRWNTRAIILDPENSHSLLDKERRKWRGKVYSLRDQIFRTQTSAINTHALEMAKEAEQAMGVASAGDVYFCLYAANVVLMNEDLGKVEEDAREIVKLIKNLGFDAFVESVNAIEAWLGTMPGDGSRNIRRVVLHTLNMADMLPTTSIYAGEKVSPSALMPPDAPPLFFCATGGATPFRFHPHVGDVGHMVNIGPTGAGKSTLLGLKVAQWFRYPNAQVFAFDKGYSVQTLALACGGDFYDIGGADESSHSIGDGFAPLDDLATNEDIAWATDYLADLCALSKVNGGVVTAKHRSAITDGLRVLVGSTQPGQGQRSLTDFLSAVQDEEVREGIKPYTLEGAYGVFLDAARDNLRDSRFMVFEMEHLMALDAQAAAPVLLYLFRRIEQRLDGSPTLIPLDECWVMLDNPLFKARIREWLKTFRRKNAVVDLYTQGVSDIADSSIKAVLLESCPTKIYLPNPEAMSANIDPIYRSLGFNSREVELIATATPKRHYYVTSPLGRRLVTLGLGPVTLAFIGVNGKSQRTEVREMMQRYPDTWPAEWLRYHAQEEEWADYWLSFNEKERKRA